jgi:hypothetical protein
MELLLNCFWLMLLVPAWWLWRRQPASVRNSRHFDSARFLLCLACILFLLFPVISATDDLRAMRSEMEEPGPSKRAVRQAGSEKATPWHGRLSAPPAEFAQAATFLLCEQSSISCPSVVSCLPLQRPATLASRAPPFFGLA